MQTIMLSVIAAAAIGIGIAVPFGLSSNSSEIVNGIPGTPASENQTSSDSENGGFVVIEDSNPPTLRDSNLRVEKVAEGLSMPTSMAFLDEDDLLILQKDNGRVRLILDGALQENPIHDVFVKRESERGLLGIAAVQEQNSTEDKSIFLYYTEEDEDVRNRVYKYDYSADGNWTGGTLVLDLPGTPGPNHDGGKVAVGPDGSLYAVIGDLNRNGMLQNHAEGPPPDDTSVIMRVDFSGDPASDNPLSHGDDQVNESLARYFAYGIRNSFGIDFDPVTGHMWDTENGPSGYDEINLVHPGFNSGWESVMGPMERTGAGESDLVSFNGSHYRDPAFSWRNAQGITDIEFFNSTKFGEEYSNNIFVGDINNGNLYYFKVNEARDGISTDSADLADLVADNEEEQEKVTFGSRFNGITDIETGPDGYLYVLSFGGSLYRVVPDS
jgi:glucose/arabinose dehydrogenase